MTVYKLRGAFTASADSQANLDVQFDGVITAFWWQVHADIDADLEAFQIECSFLSSNTIQASDARGSIATCGQEAAGTPGFLMGSVNAGISGLQIPVTRGERIHLHGNLSGTASVTATIYLYVDDRVNPRLTRRR